MHQQYYTYYAMTTANQLHREIDVNCKGANTGKAKDIYL